MLLRSKTLCSCYPLLCLIDGVVSGCVRRTGICTVCAGGDKLLVSSFVLGKPSGLLVGYRYRVTSILRQRHGYGNPVTMAIVARAAAATKRGAAQR